MKQVHKKTFKQLAISTLSALAISGIIMPAQAANWLALQGTERDGAGPRAKLWGFIQAQYQQDFSDPVVTGSGSEVYIPPKLIGPNLDSQSQFNVNRARVGVRGIAMPLDSNVNYFFLAEFGRNAITEAHGGPAHITDSSITLNHIKGARFRIGLFKTPIAEEALQACLIISILPMSQTKCYWNVLQNRVIRILLTKFFRLEEIQVLLRKLLVVVIVTKVHQPYLMLI